MSQPTWRDLEDLPFVRAVAGAVIALLGVDTFLLFTRELPGAPLTGLLFLVLPAAALALRLLPPAAARHPIAGLLGPGALGSAGVGVLALLWARAWPTRYHGVEWAASMAPNVPDDVLARLEAGASPGPVLVAAALALPAALPLLAVRVRGLGLGAQLAAGALGGLVAVAPLAVARLANDGPWVVALLALAALVGVQAGGAAYLLARAPRADGEAGGGAGAAPFAALFRRDRAPWLAAAGLAAALAWGATVHFARGGQAHDEPPLEPLLARAVAALEQHRAAHGRYPPSLGDVAGIDSGLAAGVRDGYVVRYVTFSVGATWALAADPVPPRPGFRSFRAGPDGVRVHDRRGGSWADMALDPPGGWPRR